MEKEKGVDDDITDFWLRLVILGIIEEDQALGNINEL